jgi:DNA-3-methyladenine glycosylase II
LRVPVATPFRLDLTVNVLRRLSSNIVDVFTEDGAYYRAFDLAAGTGVLRVRQRAPGELDVGLSGAWESDRATELVRRMLGADRDLRTFEWRARDIPWLRDFAPQVRGVKPPRYPSLWEACVNAVTFQAVSLAAASAVMARVVTLCGTRVESEGRTLFAFPKPERLLAAEAAQLRAAGLSQAKIAALRGIATALVAGDLSEAALEPLDTPEAIDALCRLRGVGPWTAAVIALRGLGRLDVFPANDSGVLRGFKALEGCEAADLPAVLAALGDVRGMFYYMLLLHRLVARGEVKL